MLTIYGVWYAMYRMQLDLICPLFVDRNSVIARPSGIVGVANIAGC